MSQEKYKVRSLTDGDLWVELPEYTYPTVSPDGH